MRCQRFRFWRGALCAAVWFALGASTLLAVSIDVVPVGNLNNTADSTTYGSVTYAYQIGKTEVTVGQYTDFLNAVADDDTYSLYNTSMATNANIAGISRSDTSPNFTYSVIGSANKPIAFVSWGDAARFSNWLHNNQLTGAQIATTTERGAYTLDGAITNAALSAVVRNSTARWFIPSEDEWYKAAYHKNDGVTGNYWDYPTKTDSEPNSDNPPVDPSIQTNVGNFFRDDGLANGFNDGFAMTGSTSSSGSVNYLSDAGVYALAPSPYGTFDQGGNLFEWNEALTDGSGRGLRGGTWNDDFGSIYLRASIRASDHPAFEGFAVGFRVASIPEPTSSAIAVSAAIGFWWLRSRKR